MKQKINLQSNGRCPPLLEWAKAPLPLRLKTRNESSVSWVPYYTPTMYQKYKNSVQRRKKVNPNEITCRFLFTQSIYCQFKKTLSWDSNASSRTCLYSNMTIRDNNQQSFLEMLEERGARCWSNKMIASLNWVLKEETNEKPTNSLANFMKSFFFPENHQGKDSSIPPGPKTTTTNDNRKHTVTANTSTWASRRDLHILYSQHKRKKKQYGKSSGWWWHVKERAFCYFNWRILGAGVAPLKTA